MNVTVFVPIQLTIKGENKVDEVLEQLKVMSDIINGSELEANPVFNIDLVGDSEIVEDVEETDEDHILVENGDMFDGSRIQFANSFFSNSYNSQIKDWCFDNGWKLSINGKEILK